MQQGDLEFGKSFAPEDPADFEALQLKELKNGRLAMVVREYARDVCRLEWLVGWLV